MTCSCSSVVLVTSLSSLLNGFADVETISSLNKVKQSKIMPVLAVSDGIPYNYNPDAEI